MASGRLAALCIGLFDGCVEYMASDIYAQAPKASRQVEDFDPSIVVSMHGWETSMVRLQPMLDTSTNFSSVLLAGGNGRAGECNCASRDECPNSSMDKLPLAGCSGFPRHSPSSKQKQ